jgi:hypothetical protein
MSHWTWGIGAVLRNHPPLCRRHEPAGLTPRLRESPKRRRGALAQCEAALRPVVGMLCCAWDYLQPVFPSMHPQLIVRRQSSGRIVKRSEAHFNLLVGIVSPEQA